MLFAMMDYLQCIYFACLQSFHRFTLSISDYFLLLLHFYWNDYLFIILIIPFLFAITSLLWFFSHLFSLILSLSLSLSRMNTCRNCCFVLFCLFHFFFFRFVWYNLLWSLVARCLFKKEKRLAATNLDDDWMTIWVKLIIGWVRWGLRTS